MRANAHRRVVVMLLALGLVTAACGAGNDTSGAPFPGGATTTSSAASTTTTTFPVDITPAPEKPTPTTTTTAPPASAGSLPPGVDPRDNARVQVAIADLAAMLGVDESTIEVVAWEEVVWSDGAIGCPQPGMSYTQALVDGTRIVLDHDGTRYDYHSGGSRDPFYCANPE